MVKVTSPTMTNVSEAWHIFHKGMYKRERKWAGDRKGRKVVGMHLRDTQKQDSADRLVCCAMLPW